MLAALTLIPATQNRLSIGTAGGVLLVVLAFGLTALLYLNDEALRKPGMGHQRWEGPSGPTGLIRYKRGAAVVIVIGGLAGVVAGVVSGVVEHRREEHAQRVPGTVVQVLSDTSIVVEANGKRHDVGVNHRAGFTVGQEALFFADADGPFRSVSRPFDGGLGAAFAVGLVVLGLGRFRRVSAELAEHPLLPVRRVYLAPSGAGAMVFAGDDPQGARGPISFIWRLTATPAPELGWGDGTYPEVGLLYGRPDLGTYKRLRTHDQYLVAKDRT